MKKFIRISVITYLLTWLGIFLLIVIAVYRNEGGLKDGALTFIDLAPNWSFLKGFHFFFLIILGLIFLIRYFIRVYKNKGSRVFLKRLSLYLILPLSITILSYKAVVKNNIKENFNFNWDKSVENNNYFSKNLYSNDGKHRGISAFGWTKNNEKAISDIVKANIEWVAVIPFLYQEDEQTTAINTREHYNEWSRKDSIFISSIQQLRKRGVHVQLKPHLWMSSGWRSNINFDSKKTWNNWFETYRINMLHYAKMAQETNVELFCIGTELKTSVEQQPKKWQELIQEIKTIYKGELTYAANWDADFDRIEFWNELDYIGIQGYFPLTDKENPELKTIMAGWDKHITTLKELSLKHNRPILFTEIGYKSESTSTIKPWEWGSPTSKLFRKKSDKTQALAYEALFKKLWDKKWFAGIYIWQWNHRSTKGAADESFDFSPRFKPAENVITKWFGKE